MGLGPELSPPDCVGASSMMECPELSVAANRSPSIHFTLTELLVRCFLLSAAFKVNPRSLIIYSIYGWSSLPVSSSM